MIQTSRVFTARANAASGLELTVIAMVALGGTRITGGSGSILGTTLGVLDPRLPAGWAGLRRGPQRLGAGGDRHRLSHLRCSSNEFFRKGTPLMAAGH